MCKVLHRGRSSVDYCNAMVHYANIGLLDYKMYCKIMHLYTLLVCNLQHLRLYGGRTL